MKEPYQPEKKSEPQPEPETSESLPPPSLTSHFVARRLKEPDQQFIGDLCKCIRAGARPYTAARWLGVSSRATWDYWRHRTGGIYDELRIRISEATAHLALKLQTQEAQRNPSAALRRLRGRSDERREDAKKRIDLAGHTTLQKQLPTILDNASDESLDDSDLSEVELTARDFRESLIQDCGGRDTLTHAKLSLINVATGSWLIVSTLDRYILHLACTEGLAGAKYRKVWPIVETRAKLADSFAKQLNLIGLDRVPQKVGQTAVVIIPNNGRDRLAAGGTTNGPHSAHRSAEPQFRVPIATVELPPRGDDKFISLNGDQPPDKADSDGPEDDLGLT